MWAIGYAPSINGCDRPGVADGRVDRQRGKGGIVSSQSRQGRVGRARWTLASVTAVALLLGVSACSGDDDDDDDASSASEDSAQETTQATAQAELDQTQADLADANATIADQEKQISDLNAKVETGQAAAVDVQANLAAETAARRPGRIRSRRTTGAGRRSRRRIPGHRPGVTRAVRRLARRRLHVAPDRGVLRRPRHLRSAAPRRAGRHRPGTERAGAADAERVHDRPVHGRGLTVRRDRQRPHRRARAPTAPRPTRRCRRRSSPTASSSPPTAPRRWRVSAPACSSPSTRRVRAAPATSSSPAR